MLILSEQRDVEHQQCSNTPSSTVSLTNAHFAECVHFPPFPECASQQLHTEAVLLSWIWWCFYTAVHQIKPLHCWEKPHVCIFCLWMVSHIKLCTKFYNCFAYFETDCPLGDLALSDSYINFLAYLVTKPCLTRDVWQTTVPQQKAHTLHRCCARVTWRAELIECCFVISSGKR